MTYSAAHMQRAIALAEHSISQGGGPFGAVIVRSGEVIAEAHNLVVQSCDPTGHAEVRALRQAAEFVGSHALSGCEIYSSCEPCPMCLGAIFWARIDQIWFAATREDAAAAGFDDDALYQELKLPLAERSLPIACRERESGGAPFRAWKAASNKTPY